MIGVMKGNASFDFECGIGGPMLLADYAIITYATTGFFLYDDTILAKVFRTSILIELIIFIMRCVI